MLDQNTDRMWYVIGAIVIGAAIIAMGLNIFSESFQDVEDMFVGVGDSIQDQYFSAVDITPEYVAVDMHGQDDGSSFEYDEDKKTYRLRTGDGRWSGIRVTPKIFDTFEWEPDMRYEITYRMTSNDNRLITIQNEVVDAENNISKTYAMLNGERYVLQQAISVNANDTLDVKLVLHTSNQKPRTHAVIIRPNGYHIDAPADVTISNLQIRLEAGL